MIFSTAAEAFTFTLASVPIVYKLYMSSTNGALSLGLAASICISAALALLIPPPRAQQRETSDSPDAYATPTASSTHYSQETLIVVDIAAPPTAPHAGDEVLQQGQEGDPSAATCRVGRDTTLDQVTSDRAVVFRSDRNPSKSRCLEDYQSVALITMRNVATVPAATGGRNASHNPGFRDHGNGHQHSHVLEKLPAATGKTKTVAGATPFSPETRQHIDRGAARPRRQYRMEREVSNVAQDVEQLPLGHARGCVLAARVEGVAGLPVGVTRGGRAEVAVGDHPAVARQASGRGGNGEEYMPSLYCDDELPCDESLANIRPDQTESALNRRVPNADIDPDLVFVAREGRMGAIRDGVSTVEGVASITKASGTLAGLNGGNTLSNGIKLNTTTRNKKAEELVPKRRLPHPAFDGLIVGVATVPMVLSSVFLLKKLKSVNATAEVGLDEADWVEYLEAMLEASMLCAAWEVMFAVQRAIGGQGRKRGFIMSGVLMSSSLRMAALVAVCVWCCRRPLLCLFCLVIFDVIRRTMASGDGQVMRRLSLRPGEAAILAHALALWATDACLYTLQEQWLLNPSAWNWQNLRVPYRSDSMVVIQTGIIGTLMTGLAMVGARHLLPAAWALDARGYSVSYAVLAGGTAGWLSKWTALMLGSNPVTWAILYALGVPTERASGDLGFGKAPEASTVWRSLAPEWPSWAKSAGSRYWQAWSASTARLEACNGVLLGGGIDQNRPLLVAGWLVALAVVVPLTPWVSRRLSLSKSTSRKIFHALATVMFLPAISLEPDFLSLALGTALGILLALEFLRCSGSPLVARALDAYYGDFLDARDGGCVVVTHLFLLLGCAVPVWLSRLVGENAGVLPYAGVVVLGVGDAMGAVVGSSVGRLHWPGSRRTLEGSAAVFASSLTTLSLVSLFLVDGVAAVDATVDDVVRAIASLAGPVALATLMEAFTTQVDNLVLPCVLFSCLALRDV